MMEGQTIHFDKRSLCERIYAHLRNKIMHNELQAGSRIHYDQLMEELGVSRTPLRDALKELQQDGFIEVKPRSGTFVNIPKLKDIVEIFDLRKALESLALELAWPNIPESVLHELRAECDQADQWINAEQFAPFFEADRRFHRTLISYSKNERLMQMMEKLEMQVTRFRIMMTTNAKRPAQANEQHKQIIAALQNGDVPHARAMMEKHVQEMKQFMIKDFS